MIQKKSVMMMMTTMNNHLSASCDALIFYVTLLEVVVASFVAFVDIVGWKDTVASEALDSLGE